MSVPDLLEHAPVNRALNDPSTSYWLRDLLASYLGALVAPHFHRASASQSPDGH